ncbi:hypothetical protein UPYG_G00002190 [Umbra pygmaea]|uniref:FH2 domain-containing protein n=1 Tax=Umbra pygmaea TaxID=75934 RepID=A0ABD0Y404_UMBPY
MLPWIGNRNENASMDKKVALDVPQLSNEMQLNIMMKVKTGELSIEDALNQARRDTLAMEENQASQYNFSVYKYNRYRWQKRILQIDFNTKMVCCIEKGIVKRQFQFQCVKSCDDGVGTRFCVSFREKHDYELEATSLEDKHKMVQLINKIIYRNIYSHPLECSDDTYEQPTSEETRSLKEGLLSMQRGGLASFKWVKYDACLHPGQLTLNPISRRAVGADWLMENSLSLPIVIHLSDGDASVETQGSCDAFTVLTHKNEYQFRVPVTDRSKTPEAVQGERDAWVRALDNLCQEWKRKSQLEHLYEDPNGITIYEHIRAVSEENKGPGLTTVDHAPDHRLVGHHASDHLLVGHHAPDHLLVGQNVDSKPPTSPVWKPCRSLKLPEDIPYTGPALSPASSPGFVSRPASSPGFVSGLASSPGFVSSPASSPGFLSGPASSPGFVSGPASSPGFVSGLASSPGFVSRPASSPGFVSGLASSPGFVSSPASSPGFLSGPASSPGFVSGPAYSPGLAFGPTLFPGHFPVLTSFPDPPLGPLPNVPLPRAPVPVSDSGPVSVPVTSPGFVPGAGSDSSPVPNSLSVPTAISVPNPPELTPNLFIPMAPPLISKPIRKHRTVRTKAFHWDEVTPDKIEKSFWSQGKTGDIHFDTTRLHKLFAVQDLGTPGGVSETSNSVNIMLNPKVAHNFNIFLKGFPVQPGELKDKLLLVKESDGGFSDEQITSLRRYVPTPDDVEMFKSYKGSVSDLHIVDQYMMEMCNIPYLSTRLDLLLTLRELPISLQDLQPLINQKIKMCTQLYACRSFVSVLELMLAIGNYLNENAGKRRAKGIRLSTLTKLSQVRGTERGFTLMHALVEQIMLHHPSMATFTQELAEFETVPGASIKGLNAEVDVLKNELQKVIQYRKTYKRRNQGDQHQKFSKDLKMAIENYHTDLSVLTKKCDEMKKLYTDILVKFGEAKEQDSQELFGFVSQFVNNFKRTLSETR